MSGVRLQAKHTEWRDQWLLFQDEERFLFEEWISPVRLSDFEGKSVLECGCGGGQHTSFIAPIAAHVTAVDLNTVDVARERNRFSSNVRFVEGDIAQMQLDQQFDVVMCIGVIHHTDDPDRTFAAIYRHCKPGGKVIIWTYSAEGNALARYLVEPLRKLLFKRLGRRVLVRVSEFVTALLCVPVYSIYLFKQTRFLPYHAYFRNFRRLSFKRNVLNVFDKLNAPQTKFTTLEKCHQWFDEDAFDADSISIRPYVGVSYSLSGTKRKDLPVTSIRAKEISSGATEASR